MTIYLKDNFTTNELVGAVAEALVRDLRVNSFSFTGFPQISVSLSEGKEFEVFLIFNGKEAGPLRLSFDAGKRLAKHFKSGKGHDAELVAQVQDLVVALEANR